MRRYCDDAESWSSRSTERAFVRRQLLSHLHETPSFDGCICSNDGVVQLLYPFFPIQSLNARLPNSLTSLQQVQGL